MTVNTIGITSGPYLGNDIADTFSYTFKVEDKTQLSVYETDDQNVETLLTVDADYTVNNVGNDDGGTITRISGALPLNYEWYIRSDYEETQLTAFESQGAFFPDLHENAMDKLTYLIQQSLDRIGRALRFSDSYSGNASTIIPEPIANNIMIWDPTGEKLTSQELSPDDLLLNFKREELTIVPGDTVYPLTTDLNNENVVVVDGQILPKKAYGTNVNGDLVLVTPLYTVGLMFEVWNRIISPLSIPPVPGLGESGFVTYKQLGILPGVDDMQAQFNAAANFCSVNQFHLIGQQGTFPCLGPILIPKQLGFQWTMPNDSIIDSSAAVTAFNTIDAYSDRTPGVSGDFTEGLRINGGRIIPSNVAGSYGMALFYVTNTSSIRDVEIRGGDNGLLLDKEFYGFFENFKIKDCNKIGVHLLSGGTSDTGINANVYNGLFITGCENNMVFTDTAGSFSNVVVFSNCTFENSKKTSIIINGVRPVKFTGCYMEGNFTNLAAAGEVTDIDAFDTEITLDSCFINVSENHDPGAFAVKGDTSRITDTATYKSAGVLDRFYENVTTRLVYTDDSPNADFSNAGSSYDRKLENNAPITQIIERIDSYSADRTIAPIHGNVNNASSDSIVELVEIDCTTGQGVTGWQFMVEGNAYEKNEVNPTRRAVSVLIHIAAWKTGSGFDMKFNIVSELFELSSVAGEFFVTDDGVSKITVKYNGLSEALLHLKDVQWQVRDAVLRNNGDITSVNRL